NRKIPCEQSRKLPWIGENLERWTKLFAYRRRTRSAEGIARNWQAAHYAAARSRGTRLERAMGEEADETVSSAGRSGGSAWAERTSVEPENHAAADGAWHTLGEFDDPLNIELSNHANDRVIVDAVKFERPGGLSH